MTAAEKFAVYGDWLVEVVEGYTCGTGGLPAHMPECGMTPIAPIEEVFEALHERAERVIAEEVAARAPEVLYLPGGAEAIDNPEYRATIAAAQERAGGAGVLILPAIPFPEFDPKES